MKISKYGAKIQDSGFLVSSDANPVLTGVKKVDEILLIKKYHFLRNSTNPKDLKEAEKTRTELIIKFQKMVNFLAIRFKKKIPFLVIDDLIGAGNIKLINAIDNAKQVEGISSFAFQNIRGGMLKQIEQELKYKDNEKFFSTIIPVDNVNRIFNIISKNGSEKNPYQILVDAENYQDKHYQLKCMLNSLNEEHREIVSKYFGLNGENPKTSEQLAEEMGLDFKQFQYKRHAAMQNLKRYALNLNLAQETKVVINQEPLLSQEQWEEIEKIIKKTKDYSLGNTFSDYEILNAIIYKFRKNVGWNKIPKDYGSARSAFKTYKKWEKSGIWSEINDKLTEFNISFAKPEEIIIKKELPQKHRYINHQQWEEVKELLPIVKKPTHSFKKYSDFELLNAIIFKEHNDLPKNAFPDCFPSPRTVQDFYKSLVEIGAWEKIEKKLISLSILKEKAPAYDFSVELPQNLIHLTAEQRMKIVQLFPNEIELNGSKRFKNIDLVNALIHYIKYPRHYTFPKEFPSITEMKRRRVKWTKDGTWNKIVDILAETPDLKNNINVLNKLKPEHVFVTPEQWDKIKDLIPKNPFEKFNSYKTLNAILYHEKNLGWNRLPETYPPAEYVKKVLNSWEKSGTLEKIKSIMSQDPKKP